MKKSRYFLSIVVSLFILLAILTNAAHAEYYRVSYPSESRSSFIFSHACSQWVETCPFIHDQDPIPNMTIDDSYMDQEGEEDHFSPDLRTADDVFNDLEIN